jgi:hypothetical protein
VYTRGIKNYPFISHGECLLDINKIIGGGEGDEKASLFIILNKIISSRLYSISIFLILPVPTF